VCRLGVQGRVPVKLGGGNAPKELALLLMALMLDPRAGGSAAGRGLLQDALSWLLAVASDVEWRRLQGQLLEALAPPGIGPSNRWVACVLRQVGDCRVPTGGWPVCYDKWGIVVCQQVGDRWMSSSVEKEAATSHGLTCW
jgi:hypothetical protein